MKDKENKFDSNVKESNKYVISMEKKTFRYILLTVAFAILLYWGVNHTEQPLALFHKITSVLSPFIIGLCMAFVINVLMRPLENLWCKICKKAKGDWPQKIKRPVSLVFSALIFIGALFALIFMIMPEIIKTAEGFVQKVPFYISQLEGWWDEICEFAKRFDVVLPEISLNTDKILNTVTTIFKNNDSMLFDKTIDITTSIINAVVNVALAFVFSVYVLAQKEKLGRQCKNLMMAFFKEKKVNRFIEILKITNQTFTNFVTGQFAEAVILGTLCFIGMNIFRFPYAPVISLLIGATALIPVFGAFIGTTFGAFLILLTNPLKAVWFVIFIIVLQQIDNNLFYPKVVGKSVGLPGIWVLTAVTVGNNLMGVVGMLVSVPICAVIYTVLRENVRKRLNRKNKGSKYGNGNETVEESAKNAENPVN